MALTTAVITKSIVPTNLAREIDAAYRDRAELQATEADLIAFAAYLEELGITIEEFFGGDDAEPEILAPLTFLGTNPKARSMRRHGRRYTVRKDHGTVAQRRETDALNASRNSRKKNSNAQLRKRAKLIKYSGDPRVVTKLKRLGDLLIGD